MQNSLHESNVTVKDFALKRFTKRPVGCDGRQRFDGMSRTTIAVFLTLMDHVDEYHAEGLFFSHETLAKRSDCSRRSVQRAVKELQAAGYIDWRSRGRTFDPKTNKPRNLTNSYFFTAKFLHALPYDVLTGAERDVEAEEKMKKVRNTPMTHESYTAPKCPRNPRSLLLRNKTLASADADCQNLGDSEGVAGENLNGDPTENKILENTSTSKTGKGNPPSAARPPREKQKPIHPELRDQSMMIITAMRRRMSLKGYVDKRFDDYQYPDMAKLIEITGSYTNAIRYVEYVVDNWKILSQGSTGVKDSARLLSAPTLNQMLASFRIQIWWARCNGIQSKKSIARLSKNKLAEERLKRDQERINSAIHEFQRMAEGSMTMDVSRLKSLIAGEKIVTPVMTPSGNHTALWAGMKTIRI